MSDLVIMDVRPGGASQCDLVIRDGRIAEVVARSESLGDSRVDFKADVASGTRHVDGRNCIALPGLVNAHTHIDKTLWGAPWHPHAAGPSVAERIRYERTVLNTLRLPVETHSAQLIRHFIGCGTTHVRTHVDIGPENGLTHFHAVSRMREAYREWIDIELVAFPQTGVMCQPGTLELLEQAAKEGAEVIGGIDPISLDRDPKGQLDGIFAIAERHDRNIDIHLHDQGEMGAVTIEMVAERTRALGFQGRVVISHAFCLASIPTTRLDRLIELLVEFDIAIMSHGPGGGTPVPPVRLLKERGVRVFGGTDGVRDAWGPLNSGDLLERAYLISYVNGWRDDAGLELSLEMLTYGAAEVLNIPDYGLTPGCTADVVLVKAQTLGEAVAAHPIRHLVVKNGQIVATDGECIIPDDVPTR
ncbi:MAG: cytosine deaminase [Gammaproteobacteria bacterium]|jgi:cytosine deaminase